jgi:hypothetical protein
MFTMTSTSTKRTMDLSLEIMKHKKTTMGTDMGSLSSLWDNWVSNGNKNITKW